MVIASITTSLDGYLTWGPTTAPHAGLGVGGERLHHGVFGGPWTYDDGRPMGEMSGADKDYDDGLVAKPAQVSSAAGKRWWEGFTRDLDLEIRAARHRRTPCTRGTPSGVSAASPARRPR